MNSEPFAYLNGQRLPASQLVVPVFDVGFVQGVTVSEQMRTFAGKLFRLEQHLDRLERSLQIVGLRGKVSPSDVANWAQDLVACNHQLLPAGGDLGLSLFVTPGPYPTFAPSGSKGPTVGLHTYPLPFHQWAAHYECGQPLIVSRVRQVPSACWPAELKCRSRMHYFLADREAAERQPGARAILLDLDDHVVEASTANVVVYRRDQGLISPPREMILPGISVAVLHELAEQLRVPFGHRTLIVQDLLAADEVLLCSTSPCVWPVISVDGHAIGAGRPGEMFQRLLAAWSRSVGVDIRRQAETGAGQS